MNASRRTAFTLIELLIVVAIIAIFSASLIAVVTAPGFEQNRSMIERDQEAGTALLFSHFVADAHEADDAIASPRGIVFRGAGKKGEDVVYVLDGSKQVRRALATTEDSAALLEQDMANKVPAGASVIVRNVEEFSIAADAGKEGLWRLVLATHTQANRQPIDYRREMTFGVGKFWVGGAQ